MLSARHFHGHHGRSGAGPLHRSERIWIYGEEAKVKLVLKK